MFWIESENEIESTYSHSTAEQQVANKIKSIIVTFPQEYDFC